MLLQRCPSNAVLRQRQLRLKVLVTWECCEGSGKHDGFSTTFSALKKGAGEGFVCLF